MVLCAAMSASISAKDFPYPEIPAGLSSPSSRAGYLIEHFWDRADFSDRELMEQGFSDFMSVFNVADTVARRAAMDNLAAITAANDAMAEIVEDYLYTPASPVYDEESFIVYLQSFIANADIEEERKVRPRYLLAEASLNRVGQRASDINMTVDGGREMTLNGLLDGVAEVLLIFYDPECEDCHEAVAYLGASPEVARRIADGTLKVVAVYPDSDSELWKSSLAGFPAEWTVGMCDVTDSYAIREFPSIYLLAPDGKVMRKNAAAQSLGF